MLLADRHANGAALPTLAWIGAWLRSALPGRLSPSAKTPPRDPVREAAEGRPWAARIQRTDPRFAADLVAVLAAV